MVYEPYEKIFEIFVETLVEVDFGVISLYDENNKIIITLSLADLKYEAAEKYPYDMFYLNLINMKNVKIYAHENEKESESPTKLLINILSAKNTPVTHKDELLNQIPALGGFPSLAKQLLTKNRLGSSGRAKSRYQAYDSPVTNPSLITMGLGKYRLIGKIDKIGRSTFLDSREDAEETNICNLLLNDFTCNE
jgi:hypothetical protein